MAYLNTLLQNADKNTTEITQVLANTDSCENSGNGVFGQKLALEIHSSDTSLHIKCVICVSQELWEIVDKWDKLPKGIKESIILLAKSSND